MIPLALPPAGPRARLRLAVLLAGFAFALFAHADALRRDFYFQTLTTEHGLAQNTVGAWLQDRAGFIWIGTSSGLQQYDGYGFNTYQYSADEPDGPPEGPVYALAEDDAGTIWIGTIGYGLLRHRPSSGRFERVASGGAGAADVRALLYQPRVGLWVAGEDALVLLDPGSARERRRIAFDRGQSVRQLRAGADGSLWIVTATGVLHLAPGSETPVAVADGRLASARALLVARDGSVRVATDSGVFLLGPDGSAEHTWPTDGTQPVSMLTEDPLGRLWLAVPHQGFAIFDPGSRETQWLRPNDLLPGGPPEAVVTTLDIDRSGLLWIGTMERGLSKVDPAGTPFRFVLDRSPTHPQTASNYVRAVVEDEAGDLWLGTQGDGLKRYRRAGNRFDYYGDVLAGTGTPPVDAPVTNALAPEAGGRLWVGTPRGAGLFDPAQGHLTPLALDPSGAVGLADADVRSLLAARDGTLWVGMLRGGLAHYDPRSGQWTSYRHEAVGSAVGGLSDDRVVTLAEDRAGRIWSGNMTGLNLVDPAKRSVRVFRNDPQDPHSLSANIVRSIHESADGELWIGTQAGLNRLDALDAAGARFTRWLSRDGLPSGTVYAIADDRMGRLWLSTNRGLAAFDRTAGTFRAFTLADGLQGMEYNGAAVAQLRDGELAFGGVNGLNVFAPQAIVGSRYAAPVVFTAVHVGRGDVLARHPSGEVRMALADRIVRFEFAALDFTAPERNRFAYQLEGFDDHWIEAGTRHEATYTNLGAGRYLFKVRASNHDGYWNATPGTIALVVAPPWWSSLSARALYVVVAAFGLLFAWRMLRRRRDEERGHTRDLTERENRLRLALWGSGDDFWDYSFAQGSVVITGSGDLFSRTSRPVVLSAEWLRERVHPDDRAVVERRLEAHVQQVTDTFESEHRMRNRHGEWAWTLTRGKIVDRDGDGRPLRMCGTARDMTAARAAEHDRRVAQEVIGSMSEAVAVTDLEFRFLNVNPAFTRMTGWGREEIAGQSAALLNCTQHPAEHYVALRDELVRSGHWRGELWQRRKDGDEFLSWNEISEIRDANGARSHFVSVMSDITDRKRTEQELRYLANYDALTGLPNRTLLSERIGHAIIRARRGGRKVAVLFLDLDRFKHVNDSMGHAAGDRMLKAAGGRLRQVVREGDSVARLGGDEFTVVLEEIANGAEAERVAEKIIAAFEQPLELDNGQEVVISPSIGISLYPEHGQVPTDLLKFADTAMYQAKDHGRKTYMVYTEAMDAAARLRATTVSALRKALERNELSLVYQPKLSLLDDRITGVEALLRWRSGDLGNVSPGVFIPIAEETGLIVEIGDWVVSQACAQLAHWREAGIRDITMSVNVSVAQLLRGDLIRRLCDVLAEHDIAPNQLELELTESMVMANAEQSITTLRRLKAIGVTLAIDDFGTGYSSLSYLKRLPIDALKIDKEFVGDITTDPDDEAITATVITMAHSLGLNVIAEGVERSEQVDYLREQDCDEVQGHWLSYPLPPDQCLAFLLERAERRRATLGEPHH
jgi:diguanylate cyclase (GGDEF)-like protein/PAS domain S-box-containing protein